MQRLNGLLSQIEIDVDTKPPCIELVVGGGWLFDSKRGHPDQLELYRSEGW
ncbi:MAG: hypothetical protein GWP10_19620 [Nitrospiraceae bacterium]|nr:hypothetical protein [Nitrospiraceae bacterium]